MELGFKALVIFTIVQRIAELFISKRNEKYITSIGGKVLPETNYIFMVLLHTTWLIALLYCALRVPLEFHQYSFILFTTFFLLGQFFRISAITTLGKRWSTRVMILPEAPVIKSGLFKLVRHPNYVGVILEIAALPLIAGLWKIAAIYSLLNGIILFFRIRFEEKMLSDHNDYQEQFYKGSPS